MMSFLKKIKASNLQKEYEKKLYEAMLLQRSGKIPEYAEKTAEAENIKIELEKYLLVSQ